MIYSYQDSVFLVISVNYQFTSFYSSDFYAIDELKVLQRMKMGKHNK